MLHEICSTCFFFFFNDTATTEIYTLSLHDALPISCRRPPSRPGGRASGRRPCRADRKSTRLNSSHSQISYAVFCLKKKKQNNTIAVKSQWRRQNSGRGHTIQRT